VFSGLYIKTVYRRTGLMLISTGLGLMYMLSTPMVSGWLGSILEPESALNEQDLITEKAQAIVVLGGGREYNAAEYSADTVNKISLQRIRYGAWIKRRTFLPLLVSGGRTHNEIKAEAELMQAVLQKEFGVDVKWLESKSRTTYENANYSSQLLKNRGIERIFLVTTANHMPRAKKAFEHFEIEVIAAPTGFDRQKNQRLKLQDFLPSTGSYHKTYIALHELLGQIWYWLGYY
jgi:uncharacterized SAM-binding protein YcdF (DUF218 family)